ncbi:MAG: hypothetical protein ACT6RU_14625 [Aliihoeflea sp.]|uniref:hypothetical protein n=1 Tax=Aliihoeflea sp. TaxID=2608088 RepID=UPI004033C885
MWRNIIQKPPAASAAGQGDRPQLGDLRRRRPLAGRFRTVSSAHHGQAVTWLEGMRAWAAQLEVEGVVLRITIQKLHKSGFQPAAHPGGRPRPHAPRYRVLVDGMFVQPDWGFRRALRAAKDDGVALALTVGRKVASARAAARAQPAAAGQGVAR